MTNPEMNDRTMLLQKIKTSFSSLKNEHGFTMDELLGIFRESELMVPCSLFRSEGSPLSLLVRYLVDGLKVPLPEVPEMINRSYRAVWGAYRHGKDFTKPEPGVHYLPMSCFTPGLSIMEAVTRYLKETMSMRLHDIALELGRDDRTIWTHYDRSQKKRSVP